MTAQQIINVGVTENDGTGDSIQAAGSKINHNFSQLYTDNNIDGNILWQGNKITSNLSNSDIVLTASGTGKIQLAGIKIGGTSMSSDDSTTININENLQVDGSVTATTLVGGGSGLTGTSISAVGDLSATGSTLISPSNADLTFSTAGTGRMILGDFIILDDNNITGSRTNDDINITPNGTGCINFPAIQIKANNINGLRSNDDIVITPAGTGSIVFPAITINDNNIEGKRSNDDLNLFASISGAVNVTDITIDSSLRLADNNITALNTNSDININPSGTGLIQISKIDVDDGTIDGTTVGATTPAAGTFSTISATTFQTTGLTITDNKIVANTSNDNLIFSGSGSGGVILNGFSLPASDGSSGQILRTDGSKTLSFATSPLILGVTTFADTTQDISFRSTSTIDVNTAIIAHEIVPNSSTPLDKFTSTQFDSVWYHAVTKDQTNNRFGVAKYSLARGTINDGSTIDTVVSQSHLVRTTTHNHITVDTQINGTFTQLDGTGPSAENAFKAYRIGLGDSDSSTSSGNVATIVNADVDSASESLDSWAYGSYRGAKYYISAENSDTGEVSNIEALVVHNGSDAFINSYNVVNTGNNDLLSLTAAISGSNVVLSGAALTPNTKVRMYRILLSDNETSSTGDNISLIGNKTVAASTETVIDHVTSTGTSVGNAAATKTVNSFTVGEYDSALYFVVTKDNVNTGFETGKISLMHNLNDAFLTHSSIVRTDPTDVHPTFDADIVSAGDSTSTVRLRMTDGDGSTVTPANSMAFYRIGLGDSDSTGYVGELTLVNDITKVDIIDSSSVVLDSMTKTAHVGAKYFITVNNQSTGEVGNIEALITHDNTTGYVISYNEHFSGNNSLITLTADVSGNTLSLRGSATAGGSTKVIVHRIVAFGDTESTEANSDSTRKVIGNIVTSSTATEFDTFQSSDTDAVHYVITGQGGTNENYICEATVVTDGTEVFVSHGPSITTKTGEIELLEISATISGGTVSVKAASTSGATVVQAYATRLKAPVANESIVDSWAESTFTGAHYIVVAKKDGSDDSSITELQMVTDGSDSYINASPQISTTSANLIDFSADYSDSTARLKALPTDGSSSYTLNAYRINLLREDGSSTSLTTLDTFDKTEQRSVKYLVQTHRTDDDKFEFCDINVTHNGSDAFLSIFGKVGTQTTDLVTFTADVSGDNVRLRGEVAGTQDHTVKIVKRNVNI